MFSWDKMTVVCEPSRAVSQSLCEIAYLCLAESYREGLLCSFCLLEKLNAIAEITL